jgi:hypothetical protein
MQQAIDDKTSAEWHATVHVAMKKRSRSPFVDLWSRSKQ